MDYKKICCVKLIKIYTTIKGNFQLIYLILFPVKFKAKFTVISKILQKPSISKLLVEMFFN